MAEHKHGEMSTVAQEKTFEGFVAFVVRAVIVILIAVVLMALLNA